MFHGCGLVGSAHAEPQAGGGVGEPRPDTDDGEIWVTTMIPMTVPTPARALRPMVAARANGRASNAVSRAPTSTGASPGPGVPVLSPSRAPSPSITAVEATALVEAQASTAMSWAEARTALDGRVNSRVSIGAVAELAPERPAHDEPPTPSSVTIEVTCPVVLVSASHPSPCTSGRTLSTTWLDPPDLAAATKPAPIAGPTTINVTKGKIVLTAADAAASRAEARRGGGLPSVALFRSGEPRAGPTIARPVRIFPRSPARQGYQNQDVE